MLNKWGIPKAGFLGTNEFYVEIYMSISLFFSSCDTKNLTPVFLLIWSFMKFVTESFQQLDKSLL